jgi:hypothetical protein
LSNLNTADDGKSSIAEGGATESAADKFEHLTQL